MIGNPRGYPFLAYQLLPLLALTNAKIVYFAPRAESEVLPARDSLELETIESCKTLSAVV
jgi:hypothetical protein